MWHDKNVTANRNVMFRLNKCNGDRTYISYSVPTMIPHSWGSLRDCYVLRRLALLTAQVPLREIGFLPALVRPKTAILHTRIS